jgi:hypothetical protein
MREMAELTQRLRAFAKARDWEQFHTPKNLAMALTGEVGELVAELSASTFSKPPGQSWTRASDATTPKPIAGPFVRPRPFDDLLPKCQHRPLELAQRNCGPTGFRCRC